MRRDASHKSNELAPQATDVEISSSLKSLKLNLKKNDVRPVWHCGLTLENAKDLERVQKSAVRIIMGGQHESYKLALSKLDLDTLESRRKNLCLNFAQKCLKNPKLQQMFPLNIKEHSMNTRHKQ